MRDTGPEQPFSFDAEPFERFPANVWLVVFQTGEGVMVCPWIALHEKKVLFSQILSLIGWHRDGKVVPLLLSGLDYIAILAGRNSPDVSTPFS